MPDKYLHGMYPEIGESQNLIAEPTKTVAAYVCTLPVHLVQNYKGLVNRPIMLHNYGAALRQVGYSDDWDSFTGCEAIDAHFNNDILPVGPICMINVLNPDTMRGEQKTENLTFTNGRAFIEGDKTIISTVEITGKVLGQDYSLTYDVGRTGVIVRDLKGTIADSPECTYYVVDPSRVTESDIIGEVNESERTGIHAITYIYSQGGVVPSLVLAPKWSKNKAVHDAMIAAAHKLNGKFYAFALSDLPFKYMKGGAEQTVDTIAKAIDAREALGFTEESEKTAWPMGQKTVLDTAKRYHLSTIMAVTAQQTDAQTGGIPYHSPSNKPVDLNGFYIAEKDTQPLYEEEQLNELNAKGITTIVNRGGSWRLWGPHTAAYDFYGKTDERAIFDVSMRMLYFCINGFMVRNMDAIDGNLTKNEVDAILNTENGVMDSYVQGGALLYGNVNFVPSENPVENMVTGDFVFNLLVTTPKVIKSITGKISYTNAGVIDLVEILQEDAA